MTTMTAPKMPPVFSLNLLDLVPTDSTFTLSTRPNETFTLGRWSLRVRAWAIERFTAAGVEEIFKKQKIECIAEMAFFCLKEKDKFPGGMDEFFDAVSTIQDQIDVMKAMLRTIGIGEPEIKQINDAISGTVEKKEDAKRPPRSRPKKIGANTSTP